MRVPQELLRRFSVELAVLFGGLFVFSRLVEYLGVPANDENSAVLASSPLWLVVLACVVVPAVEVLVWSSAFIEPSRYLFNAPSVGAMAGVAAYSLLYHLHGGVVAIIASGWLGSVVNGSYIMHREISLKSSFWHALGIRWCFVAFALLQARLGVDII